MATALLAGAFGQGNPGDEALLDAFAAALPGWRAVATSSRPELTVRQHGVETVPSADPRRVALRMADADAVVFAGGTIFKTLHPSSGRSPHGLLRNALALALGARLLRKPLALVGVGSGRLPSLRARIGARLLVRGSDLLVLRDEESARRLEGIGAPAPFRVGADPAWTVLDEPPPQGNGHGDVVAVALSHLAGDGMLADHLAQALEPLAALGLRVRLEPWQAQPGAGSDAALAEAVAARLGAPAEIASPPDDIYEARERFARTRVVLGLRFHALLAAASAGTPFVALAHEPKLAALARRLQQPVVAPADPPGRLTAAVLAAAESAPPSPAAVRAEIASAEEGFRLLRLLLERGSSPDAEEVTGLPLEPAP